MALETFEVLEVSYIGNKLVQVGEQVTIETDVKKGGMVIGDNLKKVAAKKEEA